MPPDLHDKLLRLLAEREIHAVLLRYCRGVDRCDADLMASCFHPDARDDHGGWTAQGAQAIAERILGLVQPGADRPMHFMGNVLIEVEGEVAFTESYILAFRAYQRHSKSFTRCRAVRFVDRFELRNGAWRISERVVVDEFNRVDEVLAAQDGAAGWRFSRKDKGDPVYAIRRGALARMRADEPLAGSTAAPIINTEN